MTTRIPFLVLTTHGFKNGTAHYKGAVLSLIKLHSLIKTQQITMMLQEDNSAPSSHGSHQKLMLCKIHKTSIKIHIIFLLEGQTKATVFFTNKQVLRRRALSCVNFAFSLSCSRIQTEGITECDARCHQVELCFTKARVI